MITKLKLFKESLERQKNDREFIMKYANISTVDDVKQFFTDLYTIYNLSFHPDDSFLNYDDGNGNDLFRYKDASDLDMIMTRCFSICDAANVDIYEIGMSVNPLVKDLGLGSDLNESNNQEEVFSVTHYNDGVPSKYGGGYNLNIDDTIEEIIDYDDVEYNKDELFNMFKNMKINKYISFGNNFKEIVVKKYLK